ncbi:MAG: hypothetical protein KDN22_03820 [Verrucomicrobiae bacterium]|nr:hypothetical protein [Verrucomicrobiae bacterium]
MPASDISVKLVAEDALHVDVDVLALKYAQANYGLDKIVTGMLADAGTDPSTMRPWTDGFRIVDSVPGIVARKVLFVGVVPLREFEYAEIRDFSRRALSSLAGEAPRTRRVGMTLHGAGYGLDESEAFESEIAGIVDAIRSQDFPNDLEEVVIIEANPGRAARLGEVLDRLLPGGLVLQSGSPSQSQTSASAEILRSAGYSSGSKNHVFVAMPFKEEMDDTTGSKPLCVQLAFCASELTFLRSLVTSWIGCVIGSRPPSWSLPT